MMAKQTYCRENIVKTVSRSGGTLHAKS